MQLRMSALGHKRTCTCCCESLCYLTTIGFVGLNLAKPLPVSDHAGSIHCKLVWQLGDGTELVCRDIAVVNRRRSSGANRVSVLSNCGYPTCIDEHSYRKYDREKCLRDNTLIHITSHLL